MTLSGAATARSIGNYIFDTVGEMSKKKLKSALEKAVQKKSLELVRGNGLSGTYRLAKAKKGGKAGAESEKNLEPLENHFANIFTWVTNPKESSVQLIRKYISLHFPKLDATGNAFRKVSRGRFRDYIDDFFFSPTTLSFTGHRARRGQGSTEPHHGLRDGRYLRLG